MWWTTHRSPREYSPTALLLLTLAFAGCEDDTIGPDESGYDCSAQSEIGQQECRGLVALFEGTNGPDWQDPSGWLADQSPCSWFGVICEGGSVSELNLRDNNVTGSIPPELGNLVGLEFLRLGENQLAGSIPPELGNLPDLRLAILSGNQLTGPIPSEMGNLSSLESLWLAANQLTGTIPAELGNLSNLQGLYLYSNQLTGPIPPEIGNLSSLERLQIKSNTLTGPIPAALGNLTNLEWLGLDSNQLTGSIPEELGNLSKLEFLQLHGNQLLGFLPLPVAQLGGEIQAAHGPGFCRIAPPGNDGLAVPDTPEYRSADLDGDGLVCALGFTTVLD